MAASAQKSARNQPSDPLQRLERRIERARGILDAAPDKHEGLQENPIAALEERIARASDPANLKAAFPAEGPLEELEQRIRQAANPTRPVEGYDQNLADTGPLERLKAAVDSEVEALGARPTIALPRQTPAGAEAARRANTGRGRAPNTADAALGRQVARLLADEPLSGTTRAEIAQRLAALVESPRVPNDVADELRSLLRLVVSDDK